MKFEAVGYLVENEPIQAEPVGYIVEEEEKKKRPQRTFDDLRREYGAVPAAGLYALGGIAKGIQTIVPEDTSKRDVIRTSEGTIVDEAGVEQLASPVDVLVGSIPLGKAAKLAKAAIKPGIGAAKKGLADIALRQSLREAADFVPQAIEKPVAQAVKAVEQPVAKAVNAIPVGEIIPDKSKWMGKIVSGKDPLLENFETTVKGAIPKQTVTRATQQDLASKITENTDAVQKLLSKKFTGGFTDADQVALADIGEKSLRDIVDHSITQGWDDTMFKKAQDDIFSTVAMARSETARATEAQKYKLAMRRLQASFGKLNRSLNEREQKELIDLYKSGGFDDPKKLTSFAQRLGDPTKGQYFWAYMYNNWLSGIPTNVKNAVSNTLWQSYQVPHGMLAAGVDKVISSLTGRKRDYLLREMIPTWAGIKSGAKKGKTGFVEIIKTGQSSDWASKFNMDIGEHILSSFERSPNPILRKAAPAVTMPTRLMSGVDIWYKSIAADWKLDALCKAHGITPDKATPEMLKKVEHFARYATFNDEPGRVSAFFSGIRDDPDHPWRGGILRMIIPFIRTSGNLTKRGIEMTPGLGLAISQKISKKVPVTKDGVTKMVTKEVNDLPNIIAKQIEGAVIAAALFTKLEKGEITAAPPMGKGARAIAYAAGKPPWSIKFGDTWFSYRGIEPFNIPIAATAIAYNEIKNAKDDESRSKIVWNVVNNIKENIISSSYFQNIQNIFSPYGDIEGAGQRTLASLVPYSSFWRSIGKATEALVEGNAKIRDTHTIAGAFSQTLPFAYGMAKPRIDALGNEVTMQGGPIRQLVPFKYSEEQPGTLYAELERLKVSPGALSKKIELRNGEKITLDDDMYREYQIRTGATIQKRLENLVNQPNYQRLSDEKQHDLLWRIIKRVRKNELNKMKTNYKFKKSMMDLEE